MITAMLMTNAVAPLTAPQPAMPAPGPVPGEQPSFGQQLQRATERSAVERDDGAEEHPAQAVHAPAHSDNAAPVADRSRSGRKPAQATEHASADGKTADKASGEAAAAAGPAAEEPASECAPDEAASAAEVVPDLAAFVASLAGNAAAARATPTAVASSAAGDDAPARVAAASKARHGARTDSPLGLAEGTPAATTPGAAPAAAAAAETTGAIAAAPSSLPAPSPAALHAAAAHLPPAASRTDAAAAASHGAAPPPATGDGVRFDALLADAAAGRGNGTPTELPRVEPTPVLQATQAADRAGAAANFTTPVPVAEATLAEPLGSRDFAHALEEIAQLQQEPMPVFRRRGGRLRGPFQPVDRRRPVIQQGVEIRGLQRREKDGRRKPQGVLIHRL